MVKAWEMEEGKEYYYLGLSYKMCCGYLQVNKEDDYWDICNMSYNDVYDIDFREYEDEE